MTVITLLDGGLGQELVHRAGTQPTPLWSTQVMLDRPDLVLAAHQDFFASGARIAVANTYALHPDRLKGTEYESRYDELFDTALALAEAARDKRGSGRIAGSIGPLVASYRPDLHPTDAIAIPLYQQVAARFVERCDLIICETVASVDHARSALSGAAVSGLPVWLAFTVDDEDGSRLRSGEPLQEAVSIAMAGADAVLVNCSAPEAIPASLPILQSSSLPFGAYANAFEQITNDFLKDKPTVDALTKRRDMSPEAYATHVLSWVDQGATIVGGCCEVGPDHIAEIARRLEAAGHTII
ncbi:MAG: homocysteine S-methyltransferase family protein [Paracoccaceae bacterium]